MAQQFVTDDGVLIVPGAYPKITVQNAPSGLATTGVLVVIGEADSGPAFTEETEALDLNAFGPDAIDALVAKYKSGAIVDAFRGGVAASNDPQISGSLSRVIPLKTNASEKATAALAKFGGGSYADLNAKLGGKPGNLIARKVTALTAEVVPTTGLLIYAPPQQSTVIAFRVNGGSEVTTTLTTGMLPAAAVSGIDGLAGVSASGGASRSLITSVAGNMVLTQDTGFQCHLVIDTAWANIPEVGDIVYIPTGSPFAAANEGTYACTAATSTRLDLYKLLDAAGSGAIVTAPATSGSVAVAATTDAQAFAPIEISVSPGAVVPGQGKSLELAESGSENVSVNLYVFVADDATPPAEPYDTVSVAGTPAVITSPAEYQVDLEVSRASDSIDEHVPVTGQGSVVLTLGYDGTTGSATIANGVLTITVTGGVGSSPDPIDLEDHTTVGDLVVYLGTLPGFVAAAGSAAQAQQLSANLDPGTYGIASTHGAPVGRIKTDGFRFLTSVNTNSVLVDVDPISPATALIGLPDASALAFLTGGSRGTTTNAVIQAALDALQAVRCNFIVPLFSRDSDEDVDDGLTDPASDYDIDSINAALKSHVLLMSQLKRRKPRQGFPSFRGSFNDAKEAAGNQAAGRQMMHFQDVSDVNATGTLTQFQPWMANVKAAGMQAAGFYRPIVNKFVNVSAVKQAAGDFNDQLDSQVEDALLAGLNVITRDPNGGFRFISDQTTYSRDNNFVYNSLQAQYVADVIAQTTAQRMELAFVGQSVADISAALALMTLEAIMGDMKRLKLIAASSDAPSGYRNAKIRISGGTMLVSIEIKLAGAIYFIPINFLVTPVQQSAG